MTFAESFHSFVIELAQSERGYSADLKFKIARHPEESLEILCARVLSFAHAHKEGLILSDGLFEPDKPSASIHDLTGQLLYWLEVGCPSAEKFQKVLKMRTRPKICLYFSNEKELHQFCWFMRGAKDNWVSEAAFYLWDPQFLEQVASTLQSRNVWNLTFIGSEVMLTINDSFFQSEIIVPDMWKEFQTTIQEAHSPN